MIISLSLDSFVGLRFDRLAGRIPVALRSPESMIISSSSFFLNAQRSFGESRRRLSLLRTKPDVFDDDEES